MRADCGAVRRDAATSDRRWLFKGLSQITGASAFWSQEGSTYLPVTEDTKLQLPFAVSREQQSWNSKYVYPNMEENAS